MLYYINLQSSPLKDAGIKVFIIVNYDTGIELSVASDEMVQKWNDRKHGAKYIEYISTPLNSVHRVIIKERKNASV